ncbi:MAG: hypothetical protein COU47_00715 [Candidatus Niyogibacteria bacterium CG10_big_fil_rev_8_21_14_0_10_46_36]|uniref:HAD family hydrolase n=1 Tax=Candidatus Niyogibacteria bacterium CG10_big_fil_rev_8_21_14_0_10_46_36 TaxID=1974726 RepID=A0A2H0TEG1_9BACT|nr:MAG: hypothetical protein COU47_00715 [Candidatus Niyogibacteria bacterium CG10_big_fil_rev_8_21_14_0_10_46_36]
MIKVIVFDFDGVIVDSPKLKQDAWFDFFPETYTEGHAAVQKVFASLQEQESRYTIFRAILKELQTPEHRIEPLVVRYADAYSKKVESKIIERGCVAGALEAIKDLSGQYSLYINSGTPEDALIRILERLDIRKYFKEVYGRPITQDGGILAAKQGNFEKILERERVSAHEMVLIGDSDTDVKAAEEVGCAFVGVRNEMNAWDEHKPFPVVHNVLDIKRYI